MNCKYELKEALFVLMFYRIRTQFIPTCCTVFQVTYRFKDFIVWNRIYFFNILGGGGGDAGIGIGGVGAKVIGILLVGILYMVMFENISKHAFTLPKG